VKEWNSSMQNEKFQKHTAGVLHIGSLQQVPLKEKLSYKERPSE